MKTEDVVKNLCNAIDILAKDNHGENIQDIKNIATSCVNILKTKNSNLTTAVKAVIFDIENQDQNSVSDQFKVICDSTGELCREVIKDI